MADQLIGKAKISLVEVMELLSADDGTGVCIACGSQQGCVEPDAEKYACESCDRRSVYGAQQLLFMIQA